MNRTACNRAQRIPRLTDIDDSTIQRHSIPQRLPCPFQSFCTLPYQFYMAGIGQKSAGAIGKAAFQHFLQESVLQLFQTVPGTGRNGADWEAIGAQVLAGHDRRQIRLI